MRTLTPPLLATLLVTSSSCGSGVVLGTLAEGQSEIPVVVSPSMDLRQPERAEWRELDPGQVTFEGFIEEGSGALPNVIIDGLPRPLQPNGRFIAPVDVAPGINIVGVNSTAPDGGRVADVRSFFAGDTNAHGEMIPAAMRVVLSRGYLDDDDAEVDDLARMGELVMDDFEFKAGMVDPFELGIAVMDPTAMNFTDTEIDVIPVDGGIVLDVTVNNLDIPFDLEIDLGLGTIDTSGGMTARSLSVTIDLVVRVRQGRLILSADSVDASFDGFAMAVAALGDDPDTAELLGSLAQSSVQTRLQDRVIGSMTAVAEALSDHLALATDVLDGALQLSLELQELSVSPAGVTVDLGAAIAATTPRGDLYPDARGSLKTPGTLSSPPLTGDGVAVVVDDDFVNQLLFAVWYSGTFHDITRTSAELGESGEALPTAFQPVRQVALGLTLPPVVTARTDAGDFFYDLSLGGVHTSLETEDDRRFRSYVGVRFPIGADAVGGELKPKMDGRTNQVVAQTGCVEAPDGIAHSSVAGMINLMIPPLLRSVPVELPELPSMALGAFISSPALSDLALSWRSLHLRALSGNTSFLVLDGDPVFREAAGATR